MLDIKNIMKEKSINTFNNIKVSFGKCMLGDENLNKMLWYWCLIPNIVVYLIDSKLINFLKFDILKLVYLFYNLTCLYFILKAVSVHPEYNVSKIEKQEEMEYKKSLSKQELKNYMSEKNKEQARDFVKKALLQKAWKKIEFYKTVRLFLILFILITLKNLLFY